MLTEHGGAAAASRLGRCWRPEQLFFSGSFFSCADSSDLRSSGSRVEQSNTAGGKYASKHGIARHSIVGVKLGAFRIAKFPS